MMRLKRALSLLSCSSSCCAGAILFSSCACWVRSLAHDANRARSRHSRKQSSCRLRFANDLCQALLELSGQWHSCRVRVPKHLLTQLIQALQDHDGDVLTGFTV